MASIHFRNSPVRASERLQESTSLYQKEESPAWYQIAKGMGVLALSAIGYATWSCFGKGRQLTLSETAEESTSLKVRKMGLSKLAPFNWECMGSLGAGALVSLGTQSPLPLTLASSACLPTARAQGSGGAILVGGEFRVNSYTAGNQVVPFLTALSNGNFVVAWKSWDQDGDREGVYAQIFFSDGTKIGSEFRVNTYVTSDQENPRMTTLSNGNFVVAWNSIDQDGSGSGVYAQILSSSGSTIGSEFRVNTYVTGDQGGPSLTALSNGNFVIAWASRDQDGSDIGVYAQIFSSTGTKIGSEFRVNTYVTWDQMGPSMTALSNGNFVIAWGSDGQDGSGYGVYAQIFSSTGSTIGSEFRVNTYVTWDQWSPSLTALSNGNFVITWMSDGQDGSGYGVYAQIFSSTGSTIGSEFRVNTYVTGNKLLNSLTALSNGNFVIAWTSNGQDGSGSGVYAQIFSIPSVLSTVQSTGTLVEPSTIPLGEQISSFLQSTSVTIPIDGNQKTIPLDVLMGVLGDSVQEFGNQVSNRVTFMAKIAVSSPLGPLGVPLYALGVVADSVNQALNRKIERAVDNLIDSSAFQQGLQQYKDLKSVLTLTDTVLGNPQLNNRHFRELAQNMAKVNVTILPASNGLFTLRLSVGQTPFHDLQIAPIRPDNTIATGPFNIQFNATVDSTPSVVSPKSNLPAPVSMSGSTIAAIVVSTVGGMVVTAGAVYALYRCRRPHKTNVPPPQNNPIAQLPSAPSYPEEQVPGVTHFNQEFPYEMQTLPPSHPVANFQQHYGTQNTGK